jgi:acyl carrier protein
MGSMWSIVEPRIRRLVAHYLGVTEDELVPELSLTEDLAADSLDLVELAVAVEDDLDLPMPDEALDGVRTYGDLVEATISQVREHLSTATPEVAVVARVRRHAGDEGSLLERAGLLTPYLAETLADDVLRAGPGSGIEILVDESVDAATRDRVHGAFAWIADRGVDIVVRSAGADGHHHSSAA